MKVYELQKKLALLSNDGWEHSQGEFKTVGYFRERAKAEEAQKSDPLPGLKTHWRIVEHDAEPSGHMAILRKSVYLS